MDRHDLICWHTMVGYLKSTDAYFHGADVFSHFGIGGAWGSDGPAKLDGVTFQWQDTAYRAAANLNGNPRIISVETADNATRPIAPWTLYQEDEIVDLMVWGYREHGIPLVLAPDSRPGRRGQAYHRLGCDPYRAGGGELWSRAYGKDCPTDARIRRLPALIERANDLVTPASGATTPQRGLFMTLTAAQERDVLDSVNESQVRLAKLDRRTNYTHAVVMALAAKVGAAVPPYDMRTDTGYPDPGDIETTGEEIARLAVDPGELTAALARALADLPDVDLTPDAITRVAQSTATLLSEPSDPHDPTKV